MKKDKGNISKNEIVLENENYYAIIYFKKSADVCMIDIETDGCDKRLYFETEQFKNWIDRVKSIIDEQNSCVDCGNNSN